MKTMTHQPQGTTIRTLSSGRRVYVTATGRVVGGAPRGLKISADQLRADQRALRVRERELLRPQFTEGGTPELIERYDDGLDGLFETDESHGRTGRWS
jgi:hypothetical protein